MCQVHVSIFLSIGTKTRRTVFSCYDFVKDASGCINVYMTKDIIEVKCIQDVRPFFKSKYKEDLKVSGAFILSHPASIKKPRQTAQNRLEQRHGITLYLFQPLYTGCLFVLELILMLIFKELHD